MAASSRLMIAEAEERFPVRIRLAQPPGGFGVRLTDIYNWLDANCGADGWAITPSVLRGVANDAVAIYFPDQALASAFVARWCAGQKPETSEALFGFGRTSQSGASPRRLTDRHCSPEPAFLAHRAAPTDQAARRYRSPPRTARL